MSPLILVGILVLTSSTLGDVKQTDPQLVADAQEINRLAVQPHNNGDYWWMNTNSPLKAAYDYYKKCAKKGNCLPPVNDDAPHQAAIQAQHSNYHEPQQQIKLDINKNPFFNGQFHGVTDNPPNSNNGGGGGGGAVQIDINKNPFFNGAITTGHGGSINDNNGQGFLGVQPSQPFYDIKNDQKKPGFALQHPLDNNGKRQKCEGHNFVCVTKDLCHNGVVNNNGLGIIQDRFENYCDSASDVCCQIIRQSTILPQQPSDLSDEITAGKSSIPGATIKFSGATGLSPGFIQVLPDDSAEIKANIYNIGEIGHQASSSSSASSTKSTRATGFGPTIDYSNVKFDDVRFQSSIQGPAYLPPIDGPRPLRPSTPGYELPPTISTYQPNLPTSPSSPRPFQTYPTVRPTYGQPSTTRPIVTTTTREYVPPQTSTTYKYVPPTVQSTTQRPFIVTQPPTTTTTTTRRPYQPSTQPTGTPYRPTYTTAPPTYGCIPSANNNYQCPRPTLPPTTSREYLPPFVVTTPRPTPPPSPTTTPRPYQPPSTTVRPYQPPSTTLRPYQPPTTTFRPYQPPSTTLRPYQPPSTTQRPYQPPSTTVRPYQPPSQPTGYVYDRPTPSFELPTKPPRVTSGTNINNQYVPPPTTKTPTNGYLPPIPNQQGDGSSINEANVPPPYVPPKRPPPPDNTGDETGNPPIFIQPNNTIVPAGCAAALKCVQEIYCTAEGVVSAVPVTLTREQQINRVPTTDCQDEQTGVVGKCCRDPDYKDPWPSANLVNGVDDGQYKEDNNFGQNQQQDLQRLVRSDRVGGPRQQLSSVRNSLNRNKPLSCGQRNVDDTSPKAPGPLDVNFAEIPWQAMILRESNRSLLCGGAIIQRNAILTTAHCVDGIDTSDILIKGGEWKLGLDEEPLPFQIVKVATVIRHPQYKAGSLQNDLAVLVLQEKLRPAENVGTICLPQPNQIPTQNCIVTGWGKRILQLHARGAIMHSINVNIMDSQQCQETLANKFQHALGNYSPNTLCGFSDIDQCKVDYGSALACQTGENQYTLSGIFSWDTGCKGDGQIGGYIAPDVEWIQNTLRTPLEQLKQIENGYLLAATNQQHY